MQELPGFDDELDELLAHEAAAVGEPIDVFVARSVAMRLVQLRARRDHSPSEPLVRYLADSEAIPESPESAVLHDSARLNALVATGLLDTPPSDTNVRTVALAAEALSAPCAAISLIDRNRQFFVSAVGLPDDVLRTRQTTLNFSVCKYVVMSGRSLVVGDTRADPLLRTHPVVVNGSVRAYLGVPLRTRKGYNVGALCVWDAQPRSWGQSHTRVLEDLALLVRDGISQRPLR